MNSNIIIKQIDGTNIDQFFELYKQTALESFEEWTSESKELWFNYYYTPEFWTKNVSEENLPVFVALDSNRMVGYVAVEEINYGVAYLGWIAVLNEYKNQGIGNELVRTIEEWCLKQNNIHKIELETQIPNLKSFYEKNGFILEGVRPKSWQKLDNYMYGKILK